MGGGMDLTFVQPIERGDTVALGTNFFEVLQTNPGIFSMQLKSPQRPSCRKHSHVSQSKHALFGLLEYF